MTETKQRSELIHRILIILVIVLAVALFLEWRVVRNRWVEEELSVEPVTETLVVHSPDEIDWGREEAAEDGIPGIGRGSGQNRKVEGFLDLEKGRQERSDHSPLIQPHTVQNNEEHRPVIQHGEEEFLHQIDGEEG